MKLFNKYAALLKLENKNNNKTKRITIVVSVIVLVFAILYFSFARFEAIQTYSLINAKVGRFGKKLTDFLLSLDSTELAYDGIEELGELGTVDNNLRYIGKDPSNYIYFNCTTTNPDEMNSTTCETWRIIGMFNNVEDENGNSGSRIKIINSTGYNKYSWDSSIESINKGLGINQWGESVYEDGTPYEGADLMRELNTDYLGNITVGTDGYWYNKNNNGKNAIKPSSVLNENAQSMIETVKWHTGRVETGLENTVAHIVYANERGGATTKNCSGDYCNDEVIRTPYWIGKVALMYMSDFLYATSGNNGTDRETCLGYNVVDFKEVDYYNGCQNYSWLRRSVAQSIYTLTPLINSGCGLMDNYVSGTYVGYAAVSQLNLYEIKPSLYLKSNVINFGGDGTINNPYKIGI